MAHVKHLGAVLREARLKLGIKQNEVAKRAGISGPYLCQLEHGRERMPSKQVITQLADVLELDSHWLLQCSAHSMGQSFQSTESIDSDAHFQAIEDLLISLSRTCDSHPLADEIEALSVHLAPKRDRGSHDDELPTLHAYRTSDGWGFKAFTPNSAMGRRLREVDRGLRGGSDVIRGETVQKANRKEEAHD